MKTFITTLLLTLCVSGLFASTADLQQVKDTTYVLRGRVITQDTDEPLMYATITIRNSNVSSVTNQDGYFSVRVPSLLRNSQLIIRYLGYENKRIPVVTLIDSPNNFIRLAPSPIQLNEVEVVSGNGEQLITDALSRIRENYPDDPNMMIAFYRESIKKGSNYISLVEAVLDIYKASYSSFQNDQARIYIGRKATDISPRDTILMKFQGGISDALLLDIAKNPEIVFGKDGAEYTFDVKGLININDKPHYMISFAPRAGIKDILFRGDIYLDVKSLAFTRMEFNMNVEDRKDASNIFIKKKPSKMRVAVDHAKYTVNYVEQDGKWYFNYSSTDVAFKVRWTNRFFGLFSTMYTISSEMAITDRYTDDVVKFPRKERIRSTDVIAEKVEYFQDPDFWGEYNVIEPDQEITNAIKKLSGKLLRRER
ncbi:MAG: carboxypeptidase-like regulatory domain-containing protein [Petrimonas sp.]|nr:carboxypeptidase-like regulatory domain-containing protein [Petrimonas sp.]